MAALNSCRIAFSMVRAVGGCTPLKNEASLDVLNAFTLEFQNALKKSAEGIIEAGKVLIRVKSRLRHGQWEEWVIRTLRFGERKRNGAADLRKAQELMLLARHEVISNPKYFASLPPRIQTLYVLSQIPDDDLRELIAAGVVHQGLTRKEAAIERPARRTMIHQTTTILHRLRRLQQCRTRPRSCCTSSSLSQGRTSCALTNVALNASRDCRQRRISTAQCSSQSKSPKSLGEDNNVATVFPLLR